MTDAAEQRDRFIAQLRSNPAVKRIEVIGGQTLILGDCRDVMVAPQFDAICTDPPYGIGITKSNRLAVSRGMGGKAWDDQPADMAPLLAIGCPMIVWGGNYFDLPPCRGPLVCDKNNAGRDFADFEMAWTNIDMVARRIIFRPMNMDGGKKHPTQKPIRVMEWCLGFLPDAATILDPFAGSGSTLVACQKLGRLGTGIEIDPDYFRIACERVHKAWQEPDMFIEQAAPKAQQEVLI